MLGNAEPKNSREKRLLSERAQGRRNVTNPGGPAALPWPFSAPGRWRNPLISRKQRNALAKGPALKVARKGKTLAGQCVRAGDSLFGTVMRLPN